MKNLYQKKYIKLIIEENPFVFITNSEKILFQDIEDIKFKKFKNLILQEYNKNIFNGVTYLIYGKNISNTIKNLKINISGLFLIKNDLIYIISFNKFLNILVYNNLLKYKPLFEILNGNFLWFILKYKL